MYMKELSITFFPVANADTSLLRLNDGSTIIIDCHICDNGNYDVASHLLDSLAYRDETPFVDVFVLTHPHEDHALGFQNIFYLGDPSKYTKDDKKKGLIFIDELWFAPRIFTENDLCDDAKAFKKEANRRIDLYRSGNKSRMSAGNRLRIIGATDSTDCSDLEEITTIPGETLNMINGKVQDDFHFFVFAPVKRDTDNDELTLNDTSIVMQARFDVDGEEDAVRVFFGGDAESLVWQRIVNRNIKSDNLLWDLLLCPHHCSWTFFNSGDNEGDPVDEVQYLLKQKRDGAYAVSSSKPIKDDDDNPPSFRAKKEYIKVVGERHFLCTGEHPNEKEPKPIYFTMSKKGLTKSDLMGPNQKATVSVISNATSTPRTYG